MLCCFGQGPSPDEMQPLLPTQSQKPPITETRFPQSEFTRVVQSDFLTSLQTKQILFTIRNSQTRSAQEFNVPLTWNTELILDQERRCHRAIFATLTSSNTTEETADEEAKAKEITTVALYLIRANPNEKQQGINLTCINSFPWSKKQINELGFNPVEMQLIYKNSTKNSTLSLKTFHFFDFNNPHISCIFTEKAPAPLEFERVISNPTPGKRPKKSSKKPLPLRLQAMLNSLTSPGS